jgi:hydroxymethylbilane synthase
VVLLVNLVKKRADMKLIVGTRKSPLSIVQSKSVARLLEAAGAEVELRPIKTVGDTLDVALSEQGGKGVFVREIDEALIRGEIDIAVHNMKDVGAQLPRGVAIAAVPAREDPREAFISTKALKLSGLPKGARIGTSSPPRRAQLFRLRPDLEIVALKGNVEARLKKLEAGKVDAIILAACGIKRLGIEKVITECLSIDKMIPAIGQGALAVEVRAGEKDLISFVQKSCHNRATGIAIRAERSFFKAVGGDYTIPVAAHAEIQPSGISMIAFMTTPDEAHYVVEKSSGRIEDAVEIGAELGKRLMKKLASQSQN